MNQVLSRELRKYSDQENREAWKQIKAYLDGYALHIYRIQPAVWFKRYGAHTGEPDYTELIFFNTISGGSLAAKYGLRRCYALAGLHAYEREDLKGAGRAILLIAHLADGLRALKAKDNARKPRKPRARAKHEQIRQDAFHFLDKIKTGKPERSIVAILKRSHPYSSRHLRRILRKKADK